MLLRHRLTLITVGTLAIGGMLSGCAPTPAPSPTPTPAFASDEEAFAAAEEVYRAYNDAGNARNAGLSEPNPQDYLVGEALEGDIDALNLLSKNQFTVKGIAKVQSFLRVEVQLGKEATTVVAIVCLDVSDVHLHDNSGQDITPADRPGVVAQMVTLYGASRHLSIGLEESTGAERCA